METLDFLRRMTPEFNPAINLLNVMVIIWSAGVLFRKLRQPPVLGELLAGIIFGPSCLGIVHPDETLKVLAELGVFFLMFYAGLHTRPEHLRRVGRQSVLVGLYGFFLPFAAGYSVSAYLFGLSQMQSLFVALGLSITAIAVNVRILHDMSLQNCRVAPVICGAAVIDDVLSLAVLSSIISLAAGGGVFSPLVLLFSLAKVLAFFGLTILIGKKLLSHMSELFSSREAKGFTFALIVALVYGILAELAGLHIIIGAYMAGLFVRDSIRNEALFQKIDDRFVAITYGFLGPIFFVSLSFHMNFSIFAESPGVLGAFLAVAIFSKFVGAALGALQGRMNLTESAVVGLAMNGRGAVELIIASIGIELGIITDSLFSILVVMAFITTLLPPISLGFLLNRVGCSNLTLLEPGPA